MQFISFAILGKRIKAIKFLMKDKNVSFGKKALIVFGLIYLFLPLDLIPPIIPVFGFLDDMILWLFILNYLKDELDKYWLGDDPETKTKMKPVKKKYRGKNIVDGVEYEVREDGDASTAGQSEENEEVNQKKEQ